MESHPSKEDILNKLDQKVEEIIVALSDGPFIFNLGHGIVPQTPPEHVAQLVNRVVNFNLG